MQGDFVHKRCMRDNGRYADLINGVVFRGRQVIAPDSLVELDTQTGIDKPANRRYSKRKKEKNRDVVRKLCLGVNFMVVGIEGQSRTDYLMALRNLSYEVMEYERQAAILRKEVRTSDDTSPEEYMSGFRQT